ncbi:MAG: hypothetical protein V1899_13080, partial [Planctomycetota bacterium]
PKTRPRRIVIDRSLILQCLALSALVAALSAPLLARSSDCGRGLVLVVDNGPTSRARTPDGMQLFKIVCEKLTTICRALKSADRVFLVQAAPQPGLLAPEGLTPRAACEQIETLRPVLSGLTPAEIISFAVDTARHIGSSRPLPVVVISLRDGPLGATDSQWHCVAPKGVALNNIGIVAFGAAPIYLNDKPQVQALARLRNFSRNRVHGSVTLEILNASPQQLEEKFLSLEPHGEDAVVFTLQRDPPRPIRISWKDRDGADALVEDDALIAVPRKITAPRIRFHASVPALKKLFVEALQAQILSPEDSGPADLEIYARSVPERAPENSAAILLLAPETGYRVFDVGPKILTQPTVQRDEDDPLTLGIGDRAGSAFFVPSAREILPGNFRSLLKDSVSGRALLARFLDDQNRIGFVLAFIPGLESPDGLLDPSLAAILVRMALCSSGAGEPFTVVRVAELERRSRAALSWPPTQADADQGCGVLDEKTSALKIGEVGNWQFDPNGLPTLAQTDRLDLAPWLALLAMLLLALELWLDRPIRSSRV